METLKIPNNEWVIYSSAVVPIEGSLYRLGELIETTTLTISFEGRTFHAVGDTTVDGPFEVMEMETGDFYQLVR